MKNLIENNSLFFIIIALILMYSIGGLIIYNSKSKAPKTTAEVRKQEKSSDTTPRFSYDNPIH